MPDVDDRERILVMTWQNSTLLKYFVIRLEDMIYMAEYKGHDGSP